MLVLLLFKHLFKKILLFYVILFLIVFCETGLVVTPFLPGDSLLFAVGALAARPDGLNIWILLPTLIVAAILGDSVNYWIGKVFGDKLPQRFPRLIKPQHIQKTHDFYERYGGKTIIIARFVPIVRTFAPFVAGIRVAISLAQGWQLGTGVKLLGISSVDCIAAQAAADGVRGKFSVAIDAQRGEFYMAGYEATEGIAKETSPLKLATMAEVQERERAGELLVGPEVMCWFPNGRIIFPHAAMLARLAARRSDFVAGEKLEPIYLRETTFVKAPPARALPFPT